MDRARALFVFLVVLLVCAGARGLTSVDGRSQTPAPLNGVYVVHFNVYAGSTLESAGAVTCRAWIHSKNAGPDGVRSSAVAIPVPGGRVEGGLVATAATCAVEIPFSWTGSDAQQGIVWSYEVEVVPAAGSRQATRVVTRRDIPMAVLQPGGIASMSFDVVF